MTAGDLPADGPNKKGRANTRPFFIRAFGNAVAGLPVWAAISS
jgi:hypothetical protein